MKGTADKLLAIPSKPSVELESRLRELKKYDSLAKSPPQLITEITDLLPQDKVLAVWMRKGYGFGRQVIYSPEDLNSAIATHEAHNKDYRAYNPALVKIYTTEDLSYLVSQHQ